MTINLSSNRSIKNEQRKIVKNQKKKYGYNPSSKNRKKFTNKFTFTNNLILVIPFAVITILLVIVPLIVILINAFSPASGSNSVADNWGILTGTIGVKIGKSIYISLVATVFTILIAFPFSYALSMSKSKLFKALVMVIITAPVWTNMLVKLIGLKTLFDLMGGAQNSTYGDIFTILGLTYLYIPFMIMPLYSSLETLPKNLINASKDLGRNGFYTFFAVTLPWCKQALISGIILVLLPCFTTVAVPSFLNNNNDAGMIGDVIINQGENGLSSQISLARTSVLALVVSAVMFVIYGMIVWIPKLVLYVKKRMDK